MILTLRSLAATATAGLAALTLALPAAQAAEESRVATPLADSVYLYSDATAPDTIGATYMTFEVRQGRWVGAFYQPHSSFDCFAGVPAGDRLALNVTDSYSQERYAYEVAIGPSQPTANQQDAAPSFELGGLQPLAEATDRDRELIATCRAAIAD